MMKQDPAELMENVRSSKFQTPSTSVRGQVDSLALCLCFNCWFALKAEFFVVLPPPMSCCLNLPGTYTKAIPAPRAALRQCELMVFEGETFSNSQPVRHSKRSREYKRVRHNILCELEKVARSSAPLARGDRSFDVSKVPS